MMRIPKAIDNFDKRKRQIYKSGIPVPNGRNITRKI
jgi:hypothetical protein